MADDTDLYRLLAALVPMDVVGRDKRRYGRERDGGYMLVEGVPCGRVYSFGVGYDASFERAFADAHRVPIHLHDPSIRRQPPEARGMSFVRRGLGPPSRGLVGEAVGLLERALHAAAPLIGRRPERLRRSLAPYRPNDPLARHLARRGDERRRDILLKLDIEGAEYDALLATPREVLMQCAQIVMELHAIGTTTPRSRARQLALLEHLRTGHELVHVHFNNYGTIQRIGDLSVPSLLELTWLRRDPGLVFVPSRTRYPTPLDLPNHPQRLDPPLDFWPFAPRAL